MMRCPYCGEEFSRKDAFCVLCGAAIPQNSRRFRRLPAQQAPSAVPQKSEEPPAAPVQACTSPKPVRIVEPLAHTECVTMELLELPRT